MQPFSRPSQAKVLSASKLELLVVHLQCHSGRPKEACWRFTIQYGIKGPQDHRRWTESEFEIVREELVKRSIEEVARKVNRTPNAIRNMLKRYHLSLREIRCDLFSVKSLVSALRVRNAEYVPFVHLRREGGGFPSRPPSLAELRTMVYPWDVYSEDGARLLAPSGYVRLDPDKPGTWVRIFSEPKQTPWTANSMRCGRFCRSDTPS
jgi:hypothetical protein